MQSKQAGIKFGAPSGDLDEIEADEAVIRKNELEGHLVEWNEIVGLKRRGDRKSLVIMKRPSAECSVEMLLRSNAINQYRSLVLATLVWVLARVVAKLFAAY